MKTILITGGAGFIGSNIVEGILEDGNTVKVLDNFSTGKIENLSKFINEIEVIEGDIRDRDIVDECMKKSDFVIHLAAIPSVQRSIKDPIASNDINVNGLLVCLNSASKNNIDRFVFASSSSLYGDSIILPKVESMTPNPISPYGVSKLAGEQYCNIFYHLYGLQTISFRYFNVFGPKQDPNSEYSAVIPLFINAILNNVQPIIFGDGTQSRDFTYIENIINANRLAINCDYNFNGTTVFNCACNDNYNLLTLVDEINSYMNKNIKPIFQDPRVGDIKHSHADTSLISNKMNYEVLVDFKSGIKKTIDYYTNDKN